MNKYIRSFINNLNNTWKNKLAAILLIAMGIISVPILDGDGTALLFTIMMGIPLLIEKENQILNWRD